jgi:hypothetical protein
MDDPIAAGPAPDATPQPEGPAEPPRRWRNLEARERSRRRRTFAVAAVLALATVSALVATVGWSRPVRRPALVWLGDPAGNPSDVAPIPFAESDRRALVGSGLFVPAAGPSPLSRGIAPVVAEVQAGTLVIYASARAWADPPGTDPKSQILRFSGDGTPSAPGLAVQGASLDDLFKAIADNGAARQLLILDALPPPDDPRLGAVPVDVGEQIATRVRDAISANSRLWVLVSCAAGQRPLASEAIGRSVFGYYVERGLKGDADASGDGRVSVRELADFVALRVDRWASQVLDVRQTPQLYPKGEGPDDFPLATVARRVTRPDPLPPAKDVPSYPTWLVEGWRTRDAARTAGGDREAPRVFGQIEAALLLAEQSWRGKQGEARIRSDLADRLERSRLRIAPTRTLARPRPRSLAEGLAVGETPDPETLKAVQDLVAKRAVPTPESKPGEVEAKNAIAVAEFVASPKLKTDFALADAVVKVAADDPAPARDAIVFLDRLLRSRQPRPAYVETLTLHRLADLPPASWSPVFARLALILARRGEAVQARPAALFGGSKPLDIAARLRHEAEALLATPGYARPGEVDRRVVEALAAIDLAAAGAERVEEARRLLDQAQRILPVAMPLLGLDDLEREWLASAESARVLADLLAPAGDSTEDRPLESLAARSVELRQRLAPFGPGAIAARVGRLTRADAVLGPSDLREIEALLATPLPLAEQRVALWKAGIDLERSLAGTVLALDLAGGEPAAMPPPSGSTPGSRERRASASKAMLDLAGPDQGSWADLIKFATDSTRTAEALDRASRLAWPWVESPILDRPATDRTRLRRSEEFDRLRRWLVDHYALESRDPDRSEFFAEATGEFGAAGDPPSPSLAIEAEAASNSLNPDRTEILVRLDLRATPPSGRAEVEVATADDEWLDVRLADASSNSPNRAVVPIESGSVGVRLAIALRPESDSIRAPIPPGVLVRVHWKERTFHKRIPLRIEPGSRRPRLIFAAGSSAPEPVGAEVRVRVTQGKATYSIFVQNPGERDRRFAVELADRSADRRDLVAVASTTLAVKAGETTRASFGPPPANPGAGVVEVRGPLTIRLVDLDDPTFRVTRTISVGLASPADYVRVVSARYTPPGSAGGEKSRLEFKVRAVGPIDGTPCPVELSLPPERIPGLVSPGEGTFLAKLEKRGDEAILFAEGFELDPRGDEAGYVHLAVDSLERAMVYRVGFARQGAPTVPVLDTRPAVRLKASRVATTSAPLKVAVELDSPPQPGRLRLLLGQYTPSAIDVRFQVDKELLVESSRARITLDPRGPEGTLAFEATLRDSSISFDAGKVRGRRLLRALLEDERGDPKAPPAELPLVIDDRPPTAVGFNPPPKYGLKGGTVTLRATGKVPDSGIKEVAFFIGKPVDDKRPAGAAVIPGQPVGAGREAWSAKLPLVDAKLGPLEVSVEFVPGAGPSRFATATLTVVEAIPIEPGKIKGTVKEGDRPQPGFDVVVYDDKGAEKGKAKTDDSGQFEVANLSPGNYEVVSAKPTPPTRGTARAAVKAGATAEVEVPMFRLP